MKAVVCKQYGLPHQLSVEDIPAPAISDRQVLIEVKACGVNFPDTLIIQNKYQFKPPLPFAPGGEVAGIVIEAGKEVKNVQKGDRVLALCGWGGFAEQVAVEYNRVFPIPAKLDFIAAAATLYNYGTAYHALKNRAQLKPGETLLVLGAAGGVGLAAVELGKLMGANIIAAASSDEKLALCKSKGANACINYSKDDLKARLKELTGGSGIDIVYDPVGGKQAEPALRSMAWNGRYLVVGFASGEIPQLPFNLPLLKGCSIMGIFWGSFAEKEPGKSMENMLEILQWYHKGAVQQHIHRVYKLEQTALALQDLIDRKVMGKAIIKIGNWDESIAPTASAGPAPSIATATMAAIPLLVKGIADTKNHIGKSLGPTEWLRITQDMINDFANATGDFQWVHTDTEKAKSLLPEGKTIAHGYLTISLISQFLYRLIHISDIRSSFNYGINKARFISPVKESDQIRLSAVITAAEEQANGSVKIFINCTMELKGSEKPACIAEVISLIV